MHCISFSAHVKNNSTTKFGCGHTALNRCVSAVLVFLFLSNALFTEKRSGHKARKVQHAEASSLVPEGEWLSFLETPVEHIKFSVPPESANSNKMEEESEIDVFHFAAVLEYFLTEFFSNRSDESFSVLPEPPFLSRPGVPLFVLYHAWKSFC